MNNTYKITYMKGIMLCEKLVIIYGDLNQALQAMNNSGEYIGYSEIIKVELVPVNKL